MHLFTAYSDSVGGVKQTLSKTFFFLFLKILSVPLSCIFLTDKFQQATVDGFKSTKEVRPVKSTKNSFLYLSVTNKVLSPGESLDVTFYVNGNPVDGQIYCMVSNVLKCPSITCCEMSNGFLVKVML